MFCRHDPFVAEGKMTWLVKERAEPQDNIVDSGLINRTVSYSTWTPNVDKVHDLLETFQ